MLFALLGKRWAKGLRDDEFLLNSINTSTLGQESDSSQPEISRGEWTYKKIAIRVANVTLMISAAGLCMCALVLYLTIVFSSCECKDTHQLVDYSAMMRAFFTRQKYVRIVFIGDSLVGQPNCNYCSVGTVLDILNTRYKGKIIFDGIESGVGGDTISDIRKRMDQDCLAYSPDSIIMLWDSDATDSNLEILNTTAYLSSYVENLRAVLSAFKAQTPRIAITGPVLLGENPEGKNPRDDLLDMYVRINKKVAASFGVNYINSRSFFQTEDIVRGWGKDYGYLTLHGEHFSRRGSDLMNLLYLKVIDEWYAGVS